MSLVVGLWKPTGHWFSMPVGCLSLVTVGREDQQRTRKSAITFQLLSAPSNSTVNSCHLANSIYTALKTNGAPHG